MMNIIPVLINGARYASKRPIEPEQVLPQLVAMGLDASARYSGSLDLPRAAIDGLMVTRSILQQLAAGHNAGPPAYATEMLMAAIEDLLFPPPVALPVEEPPVVEPAAWAPEVSAEQIAAPLEAA